MSLGKKRIALWLLLSLCVSGIAWLYAHQILGPWANARDLQKNGITSQMGDLYPRWLGARDLFLYSRNPYGPEVSHEIQTDFYGHALTPEDAARGVVDEQRFAYPVYVVFLLAPTIHADFSRIQFWTPFILAFFVAVSVVLCVDLLDWRVPWPTIATLILFTVSCPQIVQGLRHQQLALVVACLIVAGAWCVRKGHLATSGVLLAVATIKPQMALLPLLWFFLWSAGEWRTRWRLLAGFGVTMAALIGAGEWILPGWLGYFFAGLAAYHKYFPTTSPLHLLLGNVVGTGASLVVIICVLIFAWRNRKAAGDSPRFNAVFAAFLIAALLTFPLFTPFNQAMLILPALTLVRDWARLPKLARAAFIAIVSWPWFVSLGLLLSRPRLNPESELPLLPSLLVAFVPFILPLLLFCRRDSVESKELSPG
jgi:hypothetical protein